MDKNKLDIDTLYNTYSKNLYNTALRITKSNFYAEEAMHLTFITYINYKQKDQIENIALWLKKVCIRKSIDFIRNKVKEEIFINEFIEEDRYNNNYPTDTQIHLKVAKIKDAINLLPHKYRIVLSLILFEGYDYQEIEEITKVNQGTIRSWYSRGKMHLLKLIETTE